MPESVRRDTKYSRQFLLLTPSQQSGPWNLFPLARSNREIHLIWCLWLSFPDSDGLFEQRNPLDMLFVDVPFGLRWAIRTEKTAWYGVCGCPFRVVMGYSNGENRLVWCLWLSLSPGGMSHGSGTRHWGQVPWFDHFCHTFMLPDTAVSTKNKAE